MLAQASTTNIGESIAIAAAYGMFKIGLSRRSMLSQFKTYLQSYPRRHE